MTVFLLPRMIEEKRLINEKSLIVRTTLMN